MVYDIHVYKYKQCYTINYKIQTTALILYVIGFVQSKSSLGQWFKCGRVKPIIRMSTLSSW